MKEERKEGGRKERGGRVEWGEGGVREERRGASEGGGRKVELTVFVT